MHLLQERGEEGAPTAEKRRRGRPAGAGEKEKRDGQQEQERRDITRR